MGGQVARMQPSRAAARAGDAEERTGELGDGLGEHQADALAGGEVGGHGGRLQQG